MGIYLFNRDTLVETLTQHEYQDFGKEVFPAALRSRHVQLHLFDGYWEDIGTIRAFYEANLQLASAHPPFQLISPSAPIYSRLRFLPPSQYSRVSVSNSIVADGCRIGEGSIIENSVIGVRCQIGKNVVIRNSILMGADRRRRKSSPTRPPIAPPSESVTPRSSRGRLSTRTAELGQEPGSAIPRTFRITGKKRM
jgi:glucose-1-phosphate adenylyltransferase